MNKKILSILGICLVLFIVLKIFNKKNENHYFLTLEKQDYSMKLLDTPYERTKGLSGVKPTDYSNTDIAFFVFDEESPRNFWMPDTHFDLSIVFLDNYFLVIGKETLKHFPYKMTKANKNKIPKTSTYDARYVLEIKASSPLNKKIIIGEYLNINKKE